MKRILLGLVTSIWMSAAAFAGVPCSLPFNLQNGTTADATQVMANYNALVTCLGLAAAAGANNDITALLDLTTPLIPASGGTTNYIGSTSTGSANAQVIATPVPIGFGLVTGRSITFIAGLTNTTATQINVASSGLTNVFKKSTGGPVALTGGEIQVGNVYTATFDGTEFQIADQSLTQLIPTGMYGDFATPILPAGWLLADGSAQSRTTFATLFNAIAYTSVAATTTNTSTSVVVPNSVLFQIGWFVGGSNVTCNSTISSIPDGTHIVISNAAGASGATTLTIGPHPQGDCSTTFNLPDLRGRFTAGVDGSTNITTATCANPFTLGAGCGKQTETLKLTELPTGITVTGSVNASSSLFFPVVTGGGGGSQIAVSSAGTTLVPATGALGWSYQNSMSGTLTSNNTSGAAHPILPPVVLVYKAIKS